MGNAEGSCGGAGFEDLGLEERYTVKLYPWGTQLILGSQNVKMF